MNMDDRREALRNLDEAWRRAAAGEMKPAERNVCTALDLLEGAMARGGELEIIATMVHRHVQEGRAAIAASDLLGAMLAAIAALDVLQPEVAAGAAHHDSGGRARSLRRSQAV